MSPHHPFVPSFVPSFIPSFSLHSVRRPAPIHPPNPVRRPFASVTPPNPSPNPPHPNSTQPNPPPPSSLTRRSPAQPLAVPSRQLLPLFKGPEAVLGLLLAAAALLADFARSLARLSATPPRPPDLVAARHSLAHLSDALRASRNLLVTTETRLAQVTASPAHPDRALVAQQVAEHLTSADASAAHAAETIASLRHTLGEVSEQRAQLAGRRGRAEEEKIYIYQLLQEKQFMLDQINQQIHHVKTVSAAAMEQTDETQKQLQDKLRGTETHLEHMAKERNQVEQQVSEMQQQATHLEQQVESAKQSLQRTTEQVLEAESQLRIKSDEQNAAQAVQREAEVNKQEAQNLRLLVQQLRRDLQEMQYVTQLRQSEVTEAASEAERLRSSLMAKEAQVRRLSHQLESSNVAEQESGGDPSRSLYSLEEVRQTVEAEQVALSADIAKAKIVSESITMKEGDALGKFDPELMAHQNVIEAGLRKARSTVVREEMEKERRKNAIKDVLGSIANDEEMKDGDLTRMKTITSEEASLMERKLESIVNPMEADSTDLLQKSDFVNEETSSSEKRSTGKGDKVSGTEEQLTIKVSVNSKEKSSTKKGTSRKKSTRKSSSTVARSDVESAKSESEKEGSSKSARKPGRPRKNA